MKYTFLKIIAVITFAIIYNTGDIHAKRNLPQKITIKRILENKYFLSSDNEVYIFENIEIPSINSEKGSCHYIEIKKKVEEKISGKTIIFEQIKYSNNRHLFLIQNSSLEKYFIENGYAYVITNKNQSNEYAKLQEKAKKERKGIWKNDCSNYSQYTSAWKQIKTKKSPEFFTGRVFSVSSEISIGIHQKEFPLQDISFPLQRNTDAEKCFLEESQKYIHNLLYDRQVFVKKSTKDTKYHLFIPQKGKIPGILYVQEKIIEDGYGKLPFPAISNKYFSKNISQKQIDAYRLRKGAWGKCFSEIKKLKAL